MFTEGMKGMLYQGELCELYMYKVAMIQRFLIL